MFFDYAETRFVKAEHFAPDVADSMGSPVIDEKVGAVPIGSETDTQTQQRLARLPQDSQLQRFSAGQLKIMLFSQVPESVG